MKTLFVSIIVLIFGLFSFSSSSFALEQKIILPIEERLEATVIQIKEERYIEEQGKKRLYQNVELLVTKGSLKGKKITVVNGKIPLVNIPKYEVGNMVVVTVTTTPDNKSIFFITDYVRKNPLYWLFAIFVGVTVLIGGVRGFSSLLGLGLSFIAIFFFVLPQISAGRNPVLIAILAALIIIPVTFFLSHGVNKKTLSAVLGTTVALVITGLLANFFVDAARLTGFVSEEASFVEAARPGIVNMQGLLLAGIIIGALGILDDITVSQASIVTQLKKLNPKLSLTDLFLKAMDVGKDHIASMVNTLVLVYTGAALPLLLLFINNPMSTMDVINYEIIAEEIVRTLVASIGLILAVPITTIIAVYLNKRSD